MPDVPALPRTKGDDRWERWVAQGVTHDADVRHRAKVLAVPIVSTVALVLGTDPWPSVELGTSAPLLGRRFWPHLPRGAGTGPTDRFLTRRPSLQSNAAADPLDEYFWSLTKGR